MAVLFLFAKVFFFIALPFFVMEVDVWVNFLSRVVDFVLKLRERDAFFSGNALESPEYALRESPAASGRHAVFEHLDKIDVEHHSFVVASVAHVLLLEEAVKLIDWVVELRETIAELRACDYRLEALSGDAVGVRF